MFSLMSYAITNKQKHAQEKSSYLLSSKRYKKSFKIFQLRKNLSMIKGLQPAEMEKENIF